MSWQERAERRQRQAVEREALITQAEAHAGGILTMLKAPPPGDVLYDATRVMPATGYIQKRFEGSPYQAVSVANYSTAPITVAVDGNELTPPAQGAGVKVVPAGTFRTMALRGVAITIYAAAGTTFDVTVFARPRPEIAVGL